MKDEQKPFTKADIYIASLYLAFLIPWALMVAGAILFAIWYIILKYSDFLLGLFSLNLSLTFLAVYVTFYLISVGGFLYVSNRKI
jgi:hypothetical protein